MLEKGKGPLLGKLRTMQLVEEDFQLLMRVFINEIMVGLIDTDEIISKVYWGSRKGHYADDLILEKILLFYCSMQNMEEIVHNFTNLESWYDSQL